MEDYNFWQDFFDTYQSLPDWMKALWLIVPPAFLLGLIALIMRYPHSLQAGGQRHHRRSGLHHPPRWFGPVAYLPAWPGR